MIASAILAAGAMGISNLGAISWADLRGKLEKKWPNNHEVRIVCHGHSVPAGYFLDGKVETFNAYPHLLHVALNQKYPNAVINVITTAIGGENALQGAKRFQTDVISLKPDVLTIDYSLNDRGPGAPAVLPAWKSMVEAAKQAGILVILLTPTPDLNEDILDPNANLAIHARQVRELARELDVKLVDSYQKFLDMKSRGIDLKPYMSQNNHPNRAGHLEVAAELEKAFASD
jgi:lysophospholipase L1-like esterase